MSGRRQLAARTGPMCCSSRWSSAEPPEQTAGKMAAAVPGLSVAQVLDSPFVLYARDAKEAAEELGRRYERYGFDSVTTHQPSMEALGQVIAAYRGGQLTAKRGGMTRLVVKLGSSSIASGDGLALDVIADLVTQIAAAQRAGHEVILVTSGAARLGRRLLAFEGPTARAGPELSRLVDAVRLTVTAGGRSPGADPLAGDHAGALRPGRPGGPARRGAGRLGGPAGPDGAVPAAGRRRRHGGRPDPAVQERPGLGRGDARRRRRADLRPAAGPAARSQRERHDRPEVGARQRPDRGRRRGRG